MRRIVTIMMCWVASIATYAQKNTDCISIEEVTLTPGSEEGYITFKLNGSSIYYTAYNLDVVLPEGISVVMKNGKPDVKRVNAIYPYTLDDDDNKEYTHTVSATFGVVAKQQLRVACISLSNQNLTATSGSLFKVHVSVSAYAKPGVQQIPISGVCLKAVGQPGHYPASIVDNNVTIGNHTSVPVSVSAAAKWSTCILPFGAIVPEGVKAYTPKRHDETYVYLEKNSEMEAFTPYILYSEDGYSGMLEGDVDAALYPENGFVNKDGYLSGAIMPQVATEGYVLQNGVEGVKFYRITEGSKFTIPSGKCWANIPSGSNVKSLNFMFLDEDETGVTTALHDEKENMMMYDLHGRSVSNSAVLHKGIYIKNGEKVIVNK